MANLSNRPPVIRCEDLEPEPGYPGCCGSCHEDDDTDYAGPNDEYYVCCRTRQWLEKTGKL